jgi:hypothetical protein
LHGLPEVCAKLGGLVLRWWRCTPKLEDSSVPPTAGSAVGYLHFRHVPIEGVFEPDLAGRVAFREAAGLDETAFAEVQERGRRRLLRVFMRRGLLTGNDECDMAQWERGGGFSADGVNLLACMTAIGRIWTLRMSWCGPTAGCSGRGQGRRARRR